MVIALPKSRGNANDSESVHLLERLLEGKRTHHQDHSRQIGRGFQGQVTFSDIDEADTSASVMESTRTEEVVGCARHKVDIDDDKRPA